MTRNLDSIYVRSDDGTWLAGEVHRPEGEPRCVALLIHGSFPQDRDGNIDESKKWLMPHSIPKRNLFRDIREHLLAQNIAVVVYDKRAAGESEGSFAGTDMHKTASDVLAFEAHIRKEFSQPLVFMGQSEGTRTIPMALSLGANPDGLVLQGPALGSFTEAILRQKDLAARPFLAEEPGEIAERLPFVMAFYQAFFRENMADRVQNSEDEFYELKWKNYSWLYNLNYVRQSDAQDIPKVLKAAKIPTVMIVGEHDLNTPPQPVMELQKEMDAEGFSHIETSVLPGLEHSFRRVAGEESFIDAMAKPIDPSFFKSLDAYFGKHFPSR